MSLLKTREERVELLKAGISVKEIEREYLRLNSIVLVQEVRP